MKSWFRYGSLVLGILALLVNFAFSATGEHAPRIIFLGDSITAGYGLSPSDTYPALIQHRLEERNFRYEVVNAGISGDTTSGGLRRTEWILSEGAEILVIALGANDGLRGIPSEQVEENLRGIIQKAREKIPNLTIILTGMRMPVSMGLPFTESFASVFPKVAKETKVLFVPFLLEGVGGKPDLNQDDMIHPNAKGQQRIAETLWPFIVKAIEKK